MAAIEERSGRFRIHFSCLGGRRLVARRAVVYAVLVPGSRFVLDGASGEK